MAVGTKEPHSLPHFDVRLRDWLALSVLGVRNGEYDEVGPERRVEVDHLMPDGHTPGGPGSMW